MNTHQKREDATTNKSQRSKTRPTALFASIFLCFLPKFLDFLCILTLPDIQILTVCNHHQVCIFDKGLKKWEISEFLKEIDPVKNLFPNFITCRSSADKFLHFSPSSIANLLASFLVENGAVRFLERSARNSRNELIGFFGRFVCELN